MKMQAGHYDPHVLDPGLTLQDRRVMSRNDMVWRVRVPKAYLMAIQHRRDVVDRRKGIGFLHVGVVVAGIGGQNDPAAFRMDTDSLQPLGVSAAEQELNPRPHRVVAALDLHASSIAMANHHNGEPS